MITHFIIACLKRDRTVAHPSRSLLKQNRDALEYVFCRDDDVFYRDEHGNRESASKRRLS